MKTVLTKKIERALYEYCRENGFFAVEEVTINKKYGIVDTLAYSTKGTDYRGYVHTWRCFEIKVSKSDFYSKSKVTFVGNLNYYVMPYELYDVVKNDIGNGIGVILYRHNQLYVEVSPKTRKTLVSDTILTRKFIGSMSREVDKAKTILWNMEE